MKVLITGANGFIGQELIRQCLMQGFEISILVRKWSPFIQSLADQKVQVFIADLSQPETLHDFSSTAEVVFHLAGATAALTPKGYYLHNQTATENLVQVMQKSPYLKRFVFISSLAAAGPVSYWTKPHKESDHPAPVSHYGKSKLAAEKTLLNLPFTIVRPPIVFGPHDKDLLNMIQSVKRGIVPYFMGPTRYYSIVFVSDLVKSLIALSTLPSALHETFYICHNQVISFLDLMLLIKNALHKKHVIQIPIPDTIVSIASWAGSFISKMRQKPFILNQDKLSELRAFHWVCSPEKANQLGITCSTPLAEAMQTTIDWYQKNNYL